MFASHEKASTKSPAISLPSAPENLTGSVKAWREPVKIVTYEPEPPNTNPMFLEKRVYQGSSGRVYPLPFFDRISTEPHDRLWDAFHLENEFIRLMILPEIGGRIHIGYDKINGYDFFYRQNVIKPALVGLAGPWVSGGVEFNWPQHHRPATFMPVECEIEKGKDGSVTVWCSDHDPMLHMKGMHGVCLHPEWAAVQLKARLYNRTPYTQTFLWWTNVATRVHEKYQSFFPTDVRFVADHAKRAITSFPLSDRPYYGVDYPARAANGVPEDEKPSQFKPDGSYAANDLSWYANIPVPTSYMITQSKEDFCGGYDHRANAGLMHVANHHIAPGKKQWTWGNHEFGYAWDRSLTVSDGPYIELMAGVYTDNQPDFSYLAPWETKTFTQTWYPLRGTGVPQAANENAALHIEVNAGSAKLAIGVTREFPDCWIQLKVSNKTIREWKRVLTVATSFAETVEVPAEASSENVAVVIKYGEKVLLSYNPAEIEPAKAPAVAQEPLAPEHVATVEELYLTGLHLNQYSHATRQPELYWREALRRDPGDSRCLNAMGLWHLRRGEFDAAVVQFRAAIQRLTRLNPNPYDGEPYYNLGLALQFSGKQDEAYDAFYKATWNAAWRSPGYFALAEIDASRGEFETSLEHLRMSLLFEHDNLNARALLAYVHRILGSEATADAVITETIQTDPLDVGARWLCGNPPRNGQESLDLAFDLLRAGRRNEVKRLLMQVDLEAGDGTAPMILLLLADLEVGENDSAETTALQAADAVSKDYCFPHRLEELLLLEKTLKRHPKNAVAAYLLGNLLYDRRRYEEAIAVWERAADAKPSFPMVWRNLGIAYFNARQQKHAAVDAFERAFAANTSDARVFYERDQLWKRIGRSPQERLDVLLRYPALIASRDDLSVELATLYNQLDRPTEALDLLHRRHFQPWEGGEGLVLGQYVRAHLLLGQHSLHRANPAEALNHFLAALHPPLNLGEARHLLANQSDVYYWIGQAYSALGELAQAQLWYLRAVRQKGDFQQMSVREISDMTYWSALAMDRLGQTEEARSTFRRILDYAAQLENTPPKIDYFATSLPTMLLFNEDLIVRNQIEAKFLRAQALSGFGESEKAFDLLRNVLTLDANHSGAQDLLSDLQDNKARSVGSRHTRAIVRTDIWSIRS